MARYSDQREQNIEMKYLHKVWSKVDREVTLPDSLTGDALLPLLDKVPTHKPVSREIRFSPKVFTWKSGVTYAAAFVLIVALSAFLGRGTPEVSQIPIQPADPPANPSGGLAPEADTPQADEPPQEEQAPTGAEQDVPAVADMPEKGAEQGGAAPRGGDGAQEGAAAQATETPQKDSAQQVAGIGGQSGSVVLQQEGSYTYTYRVNDAFDPTKAGYPITVNILHTSTGVLAFEMDIADMQSVEKCIVHDDAVTLIGPTGEGEVALYVYDLSLVGQPREMDSLVQPGRLLDARLYRNVVNMITYLPDGGDPECEVIPLPDSTGEGICIVSAIDIETMDMEQKAFSGSGEDVKLFNLNVYFQYEGEVTEDNEQGAYVAHVRLDGTNIELRNDTDGE